MGVATGFFLPRLVNPYPAYYTLAWNGRSSRSFNVVNFLQAALFTSFARLLQRAVLSGMLQNLDSGLDCGLGFKNALVHL